MLRSIKGVVVHARVLFLNTFRSATELFEK